VIFVGIGILQWVALKRPLKKMYQQAILDNEYDEFGRSIKKSYDNLTRAEREEMDAQKTAQMEQLLSSSTLKKIVKKGSENPEEDLNNLIGLDSVKTKVTEMVARMKFEQSTQTGKKKTRSAYGMNGRHFVFYGSAGTGKTTVARIITGFLYKYGYIKENKCVEVDGNFLKAGELSDTKTKLLIQQAYGGVLFIDEAYTITEGGAYGEAVIATLIKEMEDNRDKFTAIFAGYKNDMKRLLLSNEGFSSRIKEYLEFADYSTEEMKQIFEAMAHSSGFVVSKEALDNFEVRCNRERDLPSFGNGRTARNILDEVIDKHALNYGNGALIRKEGDRMFTNEENKFVICGCDVSTNINKSVL
jgi:stage V sporulation protein K